MNIIITGLIVDIFPVETYGNFSKRVMWIEEQDVQYPNTYSIEFGQKNMDILDQYVPGDMVKVNVDLRGRQYSKGDKKGVINTLSGWKMERVGQTAPARSTRQQTGGIPPKPGSTPQMGSGYKPAVEGEDDDLPF